MIEVRSFRLGGGGYVIGVKGDLDASGAEAVAGRLRDCEGEVVVDLLRANFFDLDALDVVVEAGSTGTTFVAERTMRSALELLGMRRYVSVAGSLSSALP